MDLIPYMYHELQEKNGSMLCAQHALNNLLQQHIYSEIDLADLAAELDRQENATLNVASQRSESQNMDDTGFFSLSVLENSLQVWGLTLVRWRSEEMQAFHDHPENQAAFILNLQNHWLPIRRFSSSKRWYNLNSFLPAPEWISPTYLDMVLSQAEEEGYSVFVVRPLHGTAANDVEGRSILPESQADLVALELGEPEGRMTGGVSSVATTNHASSSAPAASSSMQPGYENVRTPTTSPDPVKASLARSRAALEAFQREQEAALMHGSGPVRSSRRRRQEDVPNLLGEEESEGLRGDSTAVEGRERQPQQMNRFQRQQAEEEEMMRQAIEASLAEARARGENVDETPTMHASAPPVNSTTSLPPTTAAPMDSTEDEELDNDDMDLQGPIYDLLAHQRHYDDEDAALQAALTASLADGGPAVLSLPQHQPMLRSSSITQPVIEEQHIPAALPHATESTSGPTVTVESEKGDEEDEVEVIEELSPEELRRKRLERFK